jgi:hypothetical protein
MPAIQTELRVQVQGGQAPLLVQRSSLQVSSCEQFSLSVDGVPPLPVPKVQPGKKKPENKKSEKKKPERRLMMATYKPTLANVRFVAIYDGGQASGLKVKVGGSKPTALTQPLVFMDRAAAAFGSRPTIVLENESALPRTAIMLVGSDLPKDARKIELVKRSIPAAKGSGKRSKEKPSRKSENKKESSSKE